MEEKDGCRLTAAQTACNEKKNQITMDKIKNMMAEQMALPQSSLVLYPAAPQTVRASAAAESAISSRTPSSSTMHNFTSSPMAPTLATITSGKSPNAQQCNHLMSMSPPSLPLSAHFAIFDNSSYGGIRGTVCPVEAV